MNRLKAGKILAIPDASEAGNISAGEARKEILAQTVDFNAYRKRLAAAAAAEPARDQGAKQSVSGKIAPRVEDKAPLATGKDKLEVSRTEAANDAKGKPLQGRIATLEEDLVARDRALKEASSRIVDLEKNLNDLKKLAELKSQAGADLQKQAQATKPAVAEAKKPDALVPAKPAEAPKAAEPPKPAEQPKPVEPPKPADAAKPVDPGAAAKPSDGAKPVEAPKPPPPKKKPAIPPPEPEPDFIEENASLVFGGGAVLALLLGWLGVSAYRKKKQAAADVGASVAESDLSAHSVFSTTTVAPPPSEQEPSQFSSTGMGMATHHETVDPVVEADTFLAFGRDAQAEEILLEALKTDPERQAIHLKLLDIYAARKNVSQFDSVAKELHRLTGGAGAAWEKAAAMGAALDPANSLYGSRPQETPAVTAAAPMDMDATMIMQIAPAAGVSAPEEVAVASAAATEAAALDFDLDMGTADAPSAAAAAPAAEAGVAALDFDLDLGTPEPAPTAESLPQAGADEGLDINFDMPEMASPAPALDVQVAAEAPAPASDSGSIDFDFDLGAPDEAPAPVSTISIDAPAPAAGPSPAMSGLDLGGISLELDTPAETPGQEAAELNSASVKLELDTPAVAAGSDAEQASADMPDNPEVATKIELAMAYEEMGDRDGARELFQEALAEGSPAQQKVARAKLDALG